jgi:gamma-glutamyltranspeptidase/glutathione hydrolase
VQPGLARLLDRLTADGPAAYYGGPVAAAIVETINGAGGCMTTEDLAAHRGEWVEPLRVAYRDQEVLELPPPTQGVAALQAFALLDGLDLPPPGADRLHLLVEVSKVALATRDRHVSDPAWMRTAPEALLQPRRLAELRAGLDPERAAPWPPGPASDGGTAYLAAADADGMLVSLIQSNFLGFGSGLHVPGWGINLNNRGSSFRLDPGHVNALAGRKRPMHTLIPALLCAAGRPTAAFGTMGGHAQLPVQLQVGCALVDDGADPQAAVAAPRFRVEVDDGSVCAERRLGADVLDALAARGHRVRVTGAYDPGMGHAHVVAGRPGCWRVGVDPRCEGVAMGC